MKNLVVYPNSKLMGNLMPPPSKSIAHRAIICSALAGGESLVSNLGNSQDINATISCMNTLGANLEAIDTKLFVNDFNKKTDVTINCRESGSTLRFLIPIIASLGINATILGEGSLVNRPLTEYDRIFSGNEVEYSSVEGHLPVKIKGQLKGGEFLVNSDVTSQYITGMLIAGALIQDEVILKMKSTIKSRPYVDLTIEVMNHFGVEVIEKDNCFIIPKDSKFMPKDIKLECDYSQVAFWLVANEFGSKINVIGMNPNSKQGDKKILDVIENIRTKDEYTVDATNIPDLIPIIAVLAGVSKCKTTIKNAERLKYKESNRLISTANLLDVLGAKYERLDDGFVIDYVENYKGGTVDSYNDHRIAMAAAIASLKCKDNIKILDSECINKSYPDFFEKFAELGGQINGKSLRKID